MSEARDSRVDVIAMVVSRELKQAMNKFKPFNSAHEGFAVLLEEVDELWDEVRTKDVNKDNLRKEAVQVAAMAMRFIHDLNLLP